MMNCDSRKKTSGFYEFIPEDGTIVDLTQPGLFSRRQLIAVFRRRGFDRLLSAIHSDTNSLIKAYYDHIIPLPCRSRTKASTSSLANQKADQTQQSSLLTSRKLEVEHQVASVAMQRLERESDSQSAAYNRGERQQTDLDKLVIISNPNWPTSGVTPGSQKSTTIQKVESKSGQHGKRSITSLSSVSSPSPLKRPKINRNFTNLEPLSCNGKQST
ncbi:unnamed protein product [Hydatigera taeniaeformis]|uniref:Ashwin n=1 Tax=Hydatigena taeniaeformis TaxID=6205 RepID=A0A0R3X1N3_HYDTA|nr:unnamed protein product [Hydatigera taeniaeformis]